VSNPKHVCKGVAKISLNGKPVTGSVIRPDAFGSLQEVNIEVEMGS
jgi:hypothetical protein